jgi:hypothetical protein
LPDATERTITDYRLILLRLPPDSPGRRVAEVSFAAVPGRGPEDRADRRGRLPASQRPPVADHGPEQPGRGKSEDSSLTVRRFEDFRAGASDPAEPIKDQDIDGVDAETLYSGGPLASSDPALRLDSVRGYNRWLSDFSPYAPDRLLGVA